MADDFDVIVVGAGMAGSSAALRLAQGGANVLLLERGAEPGSKNLSGGILWGNDLARLLPNWSREMPLERHLVRKRFGLMTADAATAVEFEDDAWRKEPYVAHSVLRAKTDAWLARQAEAAGATLVSSVPVEKLAWEGRTVRGVVQAGETMTAPVTIVADGANSRVSLGSPIRPDPRLAPEATEIGVKEVFRLDPATIESRFSLGPGEGHAEEWVLGHLGAGVRAGGFLYTNHDTVSLGVIAQLSSLFEAKVPAHELVETFKRQPAIRRRIEGAELVEYGAKLISSGWASRPASFHGAGWLVAGDAAGFVFSNGIVIQGMNYAVRTGIEAAETALGARAAHDASEGRLAEYDRRLAERGILADFREFASMDRVKWNPRFYSVYPRFAAEVFRGLLGDSDRPKRRVRRIVRDAQRAAGVPTASLLADGVAMLRDL